MANPSWEYKILYLHLRNAKDEHSLGQDMAPLDTLAADGWEVQTPLSWEELKQSASMVAAASGFLLLRRPKVVAGTVGQSSYIRSEDADEEPGPPGPGVEWLG